MSTIEDETRRLSRFVANLLDMTKLEAGALEARQDWIDLPDAIRAAVRRARSVHPHAVFLQEFGNLAPLRGDASLVEQALFNILDNAAKFSGEGHVRVVANAAGDDAEIVVTDDGPGIHAADIDRIFIKFQRSAQGDRTVAGTGLGLAISRGMIEAMGGTVHAETPPDGRGARIVIRLPMEAGANRGSDAMNSGFRILAVDDEPQIQRFLKPSLTAAGYDVALASTGAQALRLFETLEPAIIILDLGLPDIDGKEVIRRVRETSDVPIIVLSARDREAEKIAALDLGADDYVNKPFGIGELLAHSGRSRARSVHLRPKRRHSNLGTFTSTRSPTASCGTVRRSASPPRNSNCWSASPATRAAS